MQQMETIHHRHLVAGMLFLTALINKWKKKAPPVHSRARHKDPRNRGARPNHYRLKVNRVMEHLATVHLSTIDNHTAEDAIMTAVAAARHGVAAVVRASAVHGTVVVVAAKCLGTADEVDAVCHGTAAAVAAKCHGTADEVDAACHGIAVAVAVAALWTKTVSQIPGTTC